MNRVDIQGLIQNYFSNTPYYDAASVNDSIQDGLDEIVAFTGCVWKSAVVPILNGVTYYDMIATIPDYVGVYAIFNHPVKRWLIPISLAKMQQTRIDWDTAGGTPAYFAPINFRYLALMRKPLTNGYGNMEVFYVAQAPSLGDSTVVPLPGDHEQTLETYVECDFLEMQQEFSKASRLQKDYLKNLNELRVLINARRNLGRTPQLRG